MLFLIDTAGIVYSTYLFRMSYYHRIFALSMQYMRYFNSFAVYEPAA